MKEVYIYAICDENGVGYIGKSIKPRNRFTNHLFGATHKGHKEYWYRKSIWIRENLTTIYLQIIEICNNDNWIEREIFWIDFYSKISKLTVTIYHLGQGKFAFLN